MEPQFHNVMVCKKTDCRPFLEILVEKPENISHQNLGILAGIFQIDDRSEDSSYVVNYLISIIKKEYFSRANRGSVENFESALHKANLALAKLATHENVGWIGRINAICAVIEKNNLLISQTGNASAFLLRGTTLMEITELPDESIDSNPLKTFQDVISGKIEKNDKLILTTKEIFDIFSLEELKKSALKFSRENFLQFLNTALVNELDQVAALVVDIDEKIEEPVEAPVVKKIEEVNVFSQNAFRKESTPKELMKERAQEEFVLQERQAIIREIKDERKDFVDQKTGHIYIKEPESDAIENLPQKTTIDFSASLEKLSALASASARLLSQTGIGAKEASSAFWQKSRAKITEIRTRKNAASLNALEKRMEAQIRTEKEAEKSEMTEREPERLVIEKIDSEVPRAAETKILLAQKIKTAYTKLEKLEIKAKTGALLKKTKPGIEWLKERSADGLILILQRPTRITLKLTASLKNKWHEHKAEKSVRIATRSVAGGPAHNATPARSVVTTSGEHSVAGGPASDTATARDVIVTSSEYSDAIRPAMDIAPGADEIIPANKIRYPWEKPLSKPVSSDAITTKMATEPPKKLALSPILRKTLEIGQAVKLKKVLPDFSRLKQIIKNLDQKQKISALAILLLLLIVPYLIVKWENRPKEKPVVATEAPVVAVPLEKDTNVVRIEKSDEVYSGDVAKIINLNGKIFALKNSAVVDMENQREFSLSADFQSPDLFLGMDDLNLIFIIKNNQILSLSPMTGKFQNNNLNFSTDGKVVDAKTYLTYIYLLDATNNQIYRAPRADGGFGEKTAWVKDKLDLSKTKNMAINENIFVIDGQNILKLLRGKKQAFLLESTATPIAPDSLYAQNSGTVFYILDKTNSRILKLDNDGKILAQYYNTNIKNATDFSVSEENKLIYISDKSGVKSYRIE